MRWVGGIGKLRVMIRRVEEGEEGKEDVACEISCSMQIERKSIQIFVALGRILVVTSNL